MNTRHPALAMPSRRALFKSRIKNRTLIRQVIARRTSSRARDLSDAALLPPFAVRVLTRMGFGPRRAELAPESPPDPGEIFSDKFQRSDLLGKDDVAYFESLGDNDDQRLVRYVDEQLSEALADPEWEQRQAAYPASFDILNEPLAITYSERECQGFSQYVVPQRQVERAAFARACYSRRQLLELIVDFWHNHLQHLQRRGRRYLRLLGRLGPLCDPRPRLRQLPRHGPVQRQAPGDAALPGQLRQRGRGLQRELRPRAVRAAHPGRDQLPGKHLATGCASAALQPLCGAERSAARCARVQQSRTRNSGQVHRRRCLQCGPRADRLALR